MKKNLFFIPIISFIVSAIFILSINISDSDSRVYWEIGKPNNANVEFNIDDCLNPDNKVANEWKRVVIFNVNEDVSVCFPGHLCGDSERTHPNQISICFRRKIDKPIRLTIRFIGEKKPSLPLSITPTPCFSATIDGHSLSNTNIETESDKKSQSYKWTEKKIIFNKKLVSERHEISLTQQQGCIKFDYLKLEELLEQIDNTPFRCPNNIIVEAKGNLTPVTFEAPATNDTYPNEDKIIPPSPIVSMVTKPILSPQSKEFTDSITVSIKCDTPGATIRYTTNGSEPTKSSTIYDGRDLILKETTTIKAKAFLNDFEPSDTVYESYKKKEVIVKPVLQPIDSIYEKASVSIELKINLGDKTPSEFEEIAKNLEIETKLRDTIKQVFEIIEKDPNQLRELKSYLDIDLIVKVYYAPSSIKFFSFYHNKKDAMKVVFCLNVKDGKTGEQLKSKEIEGKSFPYRSFSIPILSKLVSFIDKQNQIEIKKSLQESGEKAIKKACKRMLKELRKLQKGKNTPKEKYLLGFFYKNQRRAVRLKIGEIIGIENKSVLARVDIQKELFWKIYPYFFIGIDKTGIGNRQSDLDLPISSYGGGIRLPFFKKKLFDNLAVNVDLALEGRLLNDKSKKGGLFNFTRSIKWNEYQGQICFTSVTSPEIFTGLAYSIIDGKLNYNNAIFDEKIKFNEVDPLITFIGLRWRLSDFFQVIGEIRGVDMIKKEAKGPQKSNFLLGLELIF